MNDPYDLERFLAAQAPIFDEACRELRAGRKTSHWMWFVFPQIQGLGQSATARKYAIASREEAVAYLEHPILGERLRECTRLALAVEGRSAHAIFGWPDELKFRSSLTLFAQVADDPGLFQRALGRFYEGEPDAATLRLLDAA